MDLFVPSWGQPFHDSNFHGGRLMSHHPKAPSDVSAGGSQRTLGPIVTGGTVLAIKYKDGIMMAADTLGSYGSTSCFKGIQRVHAVGNYTMIGAGGDLSDLQFVLSRLESLVIEEFTAQDGHAVGPAEVHEYLANWYYGRRTKIDPLWNQLLVGGFKDGKSFLAYVDLLGTTYSASTLATGLGAHLAQPILREAVEGKENVITEKEAKKILEDCIRIVYYRDCRAFKMVQFATINADGPKISPSEELTTEWAFGEGIRGYGQIAR